MLAEPTSGPSQGEDAAYRSKGPQITQMNRYSSPVAL